MVVSKLFSDRLCCKHLLFLLCGCLPVFGSELHAQSPAQKIVNQLFVACANIQTMKFKLKKEERINGKMDVANSAIKYRRAPFSIYMLSITPSPGLNMLFVKGTNNNNALINTGGFPYVDLSLSPYSARLRKMNQHTLYDAGFDALVSSLKHGIAGKKFDELYKYEGVVTFNGKKCDKIVLRNPQFAYVPYTVPKSISLEVMSKGMYLGSHLIKEKNKLSGYGTVAKGTVLQIPNSFAKQVTLYIDKTTHLPVYQEIMDDMGLYAKYSFTELVINPKFAPNEFDKTFKGYNF